MAATAPTGRGATPIPDRYVAPNERRTLLEESDDEDEDENASRMEGECTVCVRRKEVKLQLSCGDWFCPHCIRTAVRLAWTIEESFPPRCHEPFTEEIVRWGAAPTSGFGLVLLWRQCRREWTTPANMRIYCSNRACGAFVPRDTRLIVGGGGLGGDHEGWGRG
jgi:ribosomal protein L37AE/L43A